MKNLVSSKEVVHIWGGNVQIKEVIFEVAILLSAFDFVQQSLGFFYLL